MSEKNNELFDESLQAIFDNRNLKNEALVVMLDNARKSSVAKEVINENGQRILSVNVIERKTVVEKADMEKIGNKILTLALAGVISFCVISGVYVAYDKGVEALGNIKNAVVSAFNNDLSMSRLSVEIGALTDSQLAENGHARTILKQNTVYPEFGNSNKFFYKHESIAKDLLRIDERLFDYAFYTVCEDMRETINHQVGPGGMSNIESVIFFLKQYSSDKDTPSKQYVSEALEGVSTLDDYLKKNNYVDKNDNPSLDEFKNACDSNAEVIAAILHGNELNEGARLS